MTVINYKRVSASAYAKFINARIDPNDSENNRKIINIKAMHGEIIQLFFYKNQLIGYIETYDLRSDKSHQIKNYYIYDTKGDTNNG